MGRAIRQLETSKGHTMKKITKIVTFYDDGTFTESVPAQQAPMPIPYNPSTPYGPLNPAPWPSYPPYTITCKASGD